MFRRKEENANDPSNPSAVATSSGSPSEHAESNVGAASSSAASQAANNTYVPTAPAAPRAQAAEPVRPAATAAIPPAASYRPAPIAEFNRGAVRSPNEAHRPAAPAAAGSTFGASADKNGGKSNRRVLTVGNDILLKGEIATCDRLVIEGRVEAKLSEVHTVEIAEVGSFKGTAEVEDAEVSGVFEGDLIVRNRLVIYASGEVRGNISYGEIEIERGGRLTGQIKTVTAGAKGKGFDSEKARAKETAAA